MKSDGLTPPNKREVARAELRNRLPDWAQDECRCRECGAWLVRTFGGRGRPTGEPADPGGWVCPNFHGGRVNGTELAARLDGAARRAGSPATGKAVLRKLLWWQLRGRPPAVRPRRKRDERDHERDPP